MSSLLAEDLLVRARTCLVDRLAAASWVRAKPRWNPAWSMSQAALLVQDVLEFLGRHLRQIGGHGVIFPHCVPCPTFGLPGGTA